MNTTKRRGLIVLALAAVLGLMVQTLAGEVRVGGLTISHAWARASAGMAKNGAAYFTITTGGAHGDRLLKFASPMARRVHLHRTTIDHGVMKMRRVKSVDVGFGAPTVLKPGGLHVMLMDLKGPLKKGDVFPMTLTFERAGRVEIQVTVE